MEGVSVVERRVPASTVVRPLMQATSEIAAPDAFTGRFDETGIPPCPVETGTTLIGR